jgi:hypothetical protein
MKKVLFFINSSVGNLEKELNEFLQRHVVTDMQYQVKRRYDELDTALHCVMVVYEE